MNQAGVGVGGVHQPIDRIIHVRASPHSLIFRKSRCGKGLALQAP
jgi:hypothetical protein